MKRYLHVATGVLVAILAASIETDRAAAQDAGEPAPEQSKLFFKNDRVQVFEVTSPAGSMRPMEFRPAAVIYYFGAGEMKVTSPDGTSRLEAVKAGEVKWVPAGRRSSENVGATEVRSLLVELGPAKVEAGTVAAARAPGRGAVGEPRREDHGPGKSERGGSWHALRSAPCGRNGKCP